MWTHVQALEQRYPMTPEIVKAFGEMNRAKAAVHATFSAYMGFRGAIAEVEGRTVVCNTGQSYYVSLENTLLEGASRDKPSLLGNAVRNAELLHREAVFKCQVTESNYEALWVALKADFEKGFDLGLGNIR
jgi:hypothetical protein